MTILKRYKCIKSNNEKAFAVGQIYPLYKGHKNYIVSNGNVKWYEKEFPLIEELMGVELNELNEVKEMLNVKVGQTYIITKSDEPWWTVGKEYEAVLNKYEEVCLVDDDGDKWEIDYLSNKSYIQFKLKEKGEISMNNIKKGQTYVCKRDDLDEWTLDKEYMTQEFSNGRPYITDDNNDNWYLDIDNLINKVFKLKEKTLDLNKLTTAELREYVDLVEEKEKAESLLNEFIERMTK